MVKVLIQIKGGIVENISTSEDCDIVIIDYDNDPDGEVSGLLGPDSITDNLAGLFETDEVTENDQRIADELRGLNF